MKGRLLSWLKGHVPTREKLGENRYLRPFAKHVLRPDLWRFNRRSVPRGVALGLFMGILIPFAHSFVAALTAVAVRANVPVAIATTFLSNPATWVLIFPTAYKIGRLLLHMDAVTRAQPVMGVMGDPGAGHLVHRLTGVGLATALGLLVEACFVAALGYLITSIGWGWWIRRKRRLRRLRALPHAVAAE